MTFHGSFFERRAMLRSCSYCGRIHDSKDMCNQKQRARQGRWTKKADSAATKVHKSHAWNEMSKRIRSRDNYMCLCCKAGLDKTWRTCNTHELSVHHIEPIAECYERRFDGSNLITVCPTHHEMCEAGRIDRRTQHELAIASMDAAGESIDAPIFA